MATIHFDITADNQQVLTALNATTQAFNNLKQSADSADKKMNLPNGKKSVQDLQRATVSAEKGISSSLSSMAAKYFSLTAAIAALVKVLKQAWDANTQFERKNSELASVLGTNKDGVKQLTQAAMELGRRTEFTATNVTELQTALARLGFSKGQILDMEGSVLKFASSVGAELGESANFAGSVLRAFNFESKDTEHVLNVLAASTTKSALDFSKLNSSMSTIAPVAHAFGLSLEDTVTLLGALANAGFDASSAATATRNILLNLADANGKLAKGLGHTATTFPEIIASLKECNEKGVDLNTTLEMTDKRSVAAFNALISGAESANQLREALGNCDGTLDEMYKTMTDNVIGAVNSLKSAWEGLLLTMQNSTGPLKNVINDFAMGLRYFTKVKELSDAEGGKYSLSRPDRARVAVTAEEVYNSKVFSSVEEVDKRIAELEKNKRWYSHNDKLALEALQQVRGMMVVDEINKALNDFVETTQVDGNKGGGGGGGGLTDEEKKKLEQLRKKLQEIQEKWKDIGRALMAVTEENALDAQGLTIKAMRDGFEKEQAELDYEHDKRVAKIREQYQSTYDEIEKLQKEEYKARNNGSLEGFVFNPNHEMAKKALAVSKEQLDNEERLYEIEQAELDRKRLEKMSENRWAYLKSYGTYKEKELAITEEYNKKIEDTEKDDEYARLALEKEKQQKLYELQKEYSATYALVFADAQGLSNNLLTQAIEATQEEIRKASESGDIEKLTELYARLKEQMQVQSDRNRGWGFAGIASAFNRMSSARNKQDSAQLFSILGFEDMSGKMMTEGITEEQQAQLDMQKAVSEVADAFSELGEELSQFEGTLGEIGTALSAIGQNASSLGSAFSGSMSDAEAYSTAISGTVQLFSIVLSSLQANKKAQEEWNRTIEQSEQKLRMLELEALEYKQQNLFGIENPYKKAIDGAVQYSEAMKNLNEQVSALAGGQVQTGTKKAIDWGNVGKGLVYGAGAGAAAGAGIFSGITTAIGAAIGAGIGLITGLLSTKVVPVFENLKDKYGELFNPDTYELNQQLLADYNKLDDETKSIVDNWNDIVEKAKEAEQQMRDNFSTIAGDIGNQLSNALVEAFRNGELYSAVDDFHNKMTTTIEDILSQLVFSATFGAMFDELEDRMMKSFGAGGDEDIVDDLIWMENEYQTKLNQYNLALSDVKDSLNKLGYDVFGTNTESSLQTATAGGFQTMSQDTASELNGRFTALQLSNELISQNAKVGVELLMSIGEGMVSNNSVLSEIRNFHMIETGYLEDIAKYTKPLLEFGDKLDKIKDNTAKL